jgi:hypothetical protein
MKAMHGFHIVRDVQPAMNDVVQRLYDKHMRKKCVFGTVVQGIKICWVEKHACAKIRIQC